MNMEMYTKQFEEDLIRRVRENELLWNLKAPSYKNIVKRNKTWQRIAAEMGAPVEKCKQRWRSLRDRFVREKRVMQDPLSTAAQQDFEPWEMFESLQFLSETVISRRKSDSYEIEHSSFMDESYDTKTSFFPEEYVIEERAMTKDNLVPDGSFTDEIVPTPSYENAAKKPRLQNQSPSVDALQSSKRENPAADAFTNLYKVFTERFSRPDPDENDLFLKMIAGKMKTLPARNKVRLQEKIFQLVNEEVLAVLESS